MSSTTTKLADAQVACATEYVEPSSSDLLRKLTALEAELNTVLVEREAVIRGLLVALLAERHAILLGPPGCGKSKTINALANRIIGVGSVFRLLLDKQTDKGEVFGAVSIRGMVEDDAQRRNLNYGALSFIWFLDEIWKASNSLLNALLTALEEREYDNDGKRIKLPLLSCFGASNEPPQDDSLRALRDRFTLCINVPYVSDRGYLKLSRQRRQPEPAINATLSLDDLAALHNLRQQVVIPEAIYQAMLQIRRRCKELGVLVSDRRLLVAYETLAAHALVCGRLEVKEADLKILEHVLWNQEHEAPLVAQVISEMNNRDLLAKQLLTDAQQTYNEAMNRWQRATSDNDKTDIAIDLVKALKKLRQELVTLATEAKDDGQDVAVIAKATSDVKILIDTASQMI